MHKIYICLVTIVLTIYADTTIDWNAAQQKVLHERAITASCSTMKTDTAPIIHKTRHKPSTVHQIFIWDTRDIDSLQIKEDSVANILYVDTYFKKLKSLNIMNQIGFFNYLLHYQLKDTTHIQQACLLYLEILHYQHQKLHLILNSQNDNSRASIYLYIRHNRNNAQIVSRYLYDITPTTH